MSIVLNTKKELFMGKRRFTAKKLSKKEFEKKVEALFINLASQYPDYFEGYYDFNENGVKYLIIGVECLSGIAAFAEDMRAEDELPEELSMFCADTDENIGSGICTMNWEDYPGQMEIKTLENGFTFMQVYSSIGDDAYMPLYNIVYFDEEDRLRIYVPYCGNLMFVGAETQMCTVGGYGSEEEEMKKLFEEYEKSSEPRKLELSNGLFLGYEKDYNFFKIYGEKYGIRGIDALAENEDAFDFDYGLMLEDIMSNVQLV